MKLSQSSWSAPFSDKNNIKFYKEKPDCFRGELNELMSLPASEVGNEFCAHLGPCRSAQLSSTSPIWSRWVMNEMPGSVSCVNGKRVCEPQAHAMKSRDLTGCEPRECELCALSLQPPCRRCSDSISFRRTLRLTRNSPTTLKRHHTKRDLEAAFLDNCRVAASFTLSLVHSATPPSQTPLLI